MSIVIGVLTLFSQAEQSQEKKGVTSAPVGGMRGELVDRLFEGWLQNSADERAKASASFLRSLPKDHLSLCKELIKRSSASGDPEIQARMGSMLKAIYRRRVLGEGLSEIGLTLGWFIDMKDGLPTSYPLVLKVKNESPAALAGFVRGDVIISMNKESCMHLESRNLLVQKLAEIPPGVELSFKVKNSSKDSDKAFEIYHKNWKGERRLITANSVTHQLNKDFDEKPYRLWCSQWMEK